MILNLTIGRRESSCNKLTGCVSFILIINSFPQIIMTGGLVALKITYIISWKVIMLAKFRFIIGRMKEEEEES